MIFKVTSNPNHSVKHMTKDSKRIVFQSNSGENVEGKWVDITAIGIISVLLKAELVQTQRKYIFTMNKM